MVEPTDKPIENVQDLLRALDYPPIKALPIRSVHLSKHPDGSLRRLVVSFKSDYEPEVRPEL